MIDDLFIPYRSHLPQQIQDDFEEDEVLILRSEITLEDLITDGTTNSRFSFEEFYSFVKRRVVFITPETAISSSCNTPSHHKYTIDMSFTLFTTLIQRTLHISGVNAQETSPALNLLLRLLLERDRTVENMSDEGKINSRIRVILKCFPTTPRQQLGSLDLSSPRRNLGHKCKISSLAQSSNSLSPLNAIDIDFRFLALKEAHCKLIFNENNNVFPFVKLSQCEIDKWTLCNQKSKEQKSEKVVESFYKEKGRLPQKLFLSCTQREFRKFSEGRLLMSNETSICELHLVLHFMLADLDVHHLVSIVQDGDSLKSLSIAFLDLDDKTWSSICKSLHINRNLKRVQLSHTENFADSHRRLTPERRRSRTNDVVQLLNVNKTLHEFNWPKFQQDKTLIQDVERFLIENKGSNDEYHN